MFLFKLVLLLKTVILSVGFINIRPRSRVLGGGRMFINISYLITYNIILLFSVEKKM